MDERKEQQAEKLLYRVRTAADILDVSRSEMYNLINRGVVDSVRIGNSIRVRADSVRRLAGASQ